MRSFAMVLLLVLLCACGSSQKKSHDMPASETMTPPPEEAQNQTQESVEISFNKGKTTLTAQAKKKISELRDRAEREGTLLKIKAITWGDLEYPSVYNSGDVDQDVTLVVKRNKELGDYLSDLAADKTIEVFNMAEREVAINKLATDPNVKRSLETAGISNTDTLVKVPGKASKSIVIFIMEEE